MSDQPNGEKPRLTINDPVDPKALTLLAQLRDAKQGMALQLVDMEQKKIQVLGAIKRVDEQTQRIFDAILVDRGIQPGTPVELDGNTGALKFLNQDAKPEPEADKPTGEDQAEPAEGEVAPEAAATS